METKRWIGVLGIVAWSLSGGAAGAADEKPPRPEAKAEAASSARAEGRVHGKADRKININEASKSDLMKLDGVDAGAAQKIIAYREAHGPFKRAQDLGKVRGVSKEIVERNASRISVK